VGGGSEAQKGGGIYIPMADLCYLWQYCNIVKQLSFSIKRKKEKLPTNKSLGPGSYIGNFYNAFREKLTTILKLCQKNCRGRKTSKLIP